MWPSSSRPSPAQLHGPHDVAGKHVNFQVDPVAWLFGAPCRVGQGVGDDIDAEAVPVYLVDGERDAVERHRALWRYESGKFGRDLHSEASRFSIGANANDAGNAVDVSGHDVSAQ